MDRTEFMSLVYDELQSDGDNNRANRIIDAADEYAESTMPRWIPVTERLPKNGEQVFVYLFGDQPYIAWIDNKGEWNTEDFTLVNGEGPVAWMPLPKLYRGEEQDE